MKILRVVCFVMIVGLSGALPKSSYYPRSYMVGGSFYANPRYAREDTGYEYLPPGQMTAMVVGDTVATNSFAGAAPPPQTVLTPEVEEDQISDQITEKQQPIIVPNDTINETEPETLLSVEDNATTETLLATTKATKSLKKTKTGKAKKPVVVVAEEDAQEDDEEANNAGSWPFGGVAGRGAYNAFFPIFIGGNPSGRSRTRENQEEGLPGSATAIANSFSTGKGGVATSHATSFGDPYAAAMLRNAGFFNNFRKSNKKQIVQIDEDEE